MLSPISIVIFCFAAFAVQGNEYLPGELVFFLHIEIIENV
jgi:hypothetical protein